MQIPEPILSLIEKYLAGKANPEEKARVDTWYHEQAGEDPVILDSVTEHEMDQRIKGRLQQSLLKERAAPVLPAGRRLVAWTAAAAIVLLLISSFFYFLSPLRPDKIVTRQGVKEPRLQQAITPGRDKAVLTLADGSTVLLDSVSNGKLSQQGSAKIIKLNNGRLTYSTGKRPASGEPVLFNTIATPRGGQYAVTLSDGTKVWLNASSSIRFPAAFAANERRVQIAGEAYFEVAENKHWPFKVAALTPAGDSNMAEVLGTRFNVNAYNDEAAVKTTLLQGAVKIKGAGAVLVLAPGQQSELTNGDGLRLNKNVDVDEVVSWKNGLFNFAGADIKTIMRQISRWYDVDVLYEGKISPETFSGIISRSSGIEKVLRIIEQAGVSIKTEGRKITVRQ